MFLSSSTAPTARPPADAPLFDGNNHAADRTILNSAFCGKTFAGCEHCLPHEPVPSPVPFGAEAASVAYYGPIKAETAGVMPVHVYRENPDGTVNTDYDYGLNMTFSITGRRLTLAGVDQVLLVPNIYHVRPKSTAGERLLCDAIPSVVPVSWADATEDYVFQLVRDCNLNGVDDESDYAESQGLDIYPPLGILDCCHRTLTCNADANADGNVDQSDVDYLVDVIAVAPNTSGFDPDFNEDGSADQGDIDALINTVAGGPCPGVGCGSG